MKKIFSFTLTLILTFSLMAGITVSASTATLEDVMKEAISNMEPSVDISSFNIVCDDTGAGQAQVRQAFQNVHNNNPYFFYVDMTYSLSVSSLNRVAVAVNFNYTYTPETVAEMTAEIDEVVDGFISNNITSSMTDLQKELAAHDYIVLNTEYVDTGYLGHTAYGALVDGQAVCEGYSLAFSLIMNKLSIPCTIVTSEEMVHAWNLVQIDGEWYHTDVTWADPTPNRKGKIDYYYFNCSSDYFKNPSIPYDPANPFTPDVHTWDEKLYSEYSATSEKYSYIHSVEQAARTNDYFYYYDRENRNLSRLALTGGTPVVLLDSARPQYIRLFGDTLYFSNYDFGGYLHSIKLDGTGLTRINNQRTDYLYIENDVLHFYLTDDSTWSSIELGHKNNIEINNAYFSADGQPTNIIPEGCDELTAHIILTNKSAIDNFKIRLLAASYSADGRLSGMNVSTVNLDAGAQQVTGTAAISVPEDVSEAKIFAYINMKPIMDTVIIE